MKNPLSGELNNKSLFRVDRNKLQQPEGVPQIQSLENQVDRLGLFAQSGAVSWVMANGGSALLLATGLSCRTVRVAERLCSRRCSTVYVKAEVFFVFEFCAREACKHVCYVVAGQ